MHVCNAPEICQALSQYPPHSTLPLEKHLVYRDYNEVAIVKRVESRDSKIQSTWWPPKPIKIHEHGLKTWIIIRDSNWQRMGAIAIQPLSTSMVPASPLIKSTWDCTTLRPCIRYFFISSYSTNETELKEKSSKIVANQTSVSTQDRSKTSKEMDGTLKISHVLVGRTKKSYLPISLLYPIFNFQKFWKD